MNHTPTPTERLKAFRAAEGWTLRDMAARLGVSHQYIGQIESGDRQPSLEQLHRFAAALGIDPHDLDERLASTLTPKNTRNER